MIIDILFKENCIKDIAASAIFGAYSRSHLSTIELEKKYLEYENNKPRYITFVEKWIKKSNHKSLLDHSYVHFYIEDVSQYIVKILETFDLKITELPLGITEKSTRFIKFNNQKPEDFIIYKDLDDSLKQDFCEIFNHQIKFYLEMTEEFTDFCKKNNINEKLALDSSRSILPSGVTTTVGISMNLRSIEKILIILYKKCYNKVNIELDYIINKLIELFFNTFDFVFDINKFKNKLESIDKYKEKVLKNTESFYDDNVYINDNTINKNTYNKYYKNVFNEASLLDIPIKSVIDVKFLHNIFSNNIKNLSTLKSMLNDIKISCDGKINLDLIDPYFLFKENDFKFSATLDFGTYRDISRHRGLSILPVSNFVYIPEYSKDLYFLMPILAEKELKFYTKIENYYTDLKNKLYDFIKKYKEVYKDYPIKILNFKILNILSYLMPMSISYNFYIKGDIKNMLHVVIQRSQIAGHYNYRKFAKELGDYISLIIDLPYDFLFNKFEPSIEDSLEDVVVKMNDGRFDGKLINIILDKLESK